MERLKRRTDFRAAAQAAAKGAKAHAGAFVLQARARGPSGPPRMGFTVSRQVGNAVERNRVRRRLREVVRLAPAETLRTGHDYVLIGRRAALALPFGDMLRDLDAALHRVHGDAAQTGTGNERSPHRAGSPDRRRQKQPQEKRQPRNPS
jgi:ribonuclease P protein component